MLGVIVFIIIVSVLFYNYFWKRRNLPPGPAPLFLIGNLLEIEANPPGYKIYKKWQQQFGPIYTYWMSEQPIVAINDYNLMYETFVKDGETFNGRADVGHRQDYLLGGRYGMIMVDGDQWREHRKFAMQVFRNFGMGRGLMEEKIKTEISYLLTELMDKLDDNLQLELNPIPEIERTIANAINQLLFGFAFHSPQEREDYGFLKTALTNFLTQGTWPSIIFGFHYPSIVPKLPYFKQQMDKLKVNYDALKAFFTKMINEHKAELDISRDPEDYVEAYLQEATKTSTPFFTDENLVNILIELWIAGQETTANTCIFSLLYVLNNPEVQKKIHKELDSQIGSDRVVTLADKNSLTYINAFINEVQRSVNLLPQNLLHKTTKDVKVGGYLIPKDTTVVPQISMVLYDEKIFPDPYAFKPERFLDSNGSLKKVEELIPFSLGKRQCLGESLARMQIFLFVTNFFNQFIVVPIDAKRPPSLDKTPGIAIQPKPFNCMIKKTILIEKNIEFCKHKLIKICI